MNSDTVERKKTVIRGIAAVATQGLNLLYLPANRGQLFLTIVTDKETYSLKAHPPQSSDIKASVKLEAIGKSLLANSKDSNGEKSQASDLPTQLKELAELHSAGVLTDEEFAAAKANLLN